MGGDDTRTPDGTATAITMHVGAHRGDGDVFTAHRHSVDAVFYARGSNDAASGLFSIPLQ